MKNCLLWLRRWQLPLLLLLSAMPILLTTLCVHAPQALLSAYLLFAAYAVLSGLVVAVPGSKRLITGIISSAALFALCTAVLAVRAYPLFLLLPAALSALLLYSLPLAARRYESDIPPYIFFSGIGVHLVVQFLNHYFTVTGGVSPYEPAANALTASLIGYMLLFLLSMNRISLDNASLSRHLIPAGMRMLNTALTIIFLLASLMLAMLPAVIRAITMLWQALRTLTAKLIALLLSLLPAAVDPGFGAAGAPDSMLLSDLPPAETSALARLAEKLATIATAILIVVGTIVLLRLLYRLMLRAVRALFRRLGEYMSSVSGDYNDEVTDTRPDGAQREIRAVLRTRRHPLEQAATPAGRIRQLYARIMRRHPKWPSSSTARENLPAEAAEFYERARYSTHPVTSEDVRRFTEGVRRL